LEEELAFVAVDGLDDIFPTLKCDVGTLIEVVIDFEHGPGQMERTDERLKAWVVLAALVDDVLVVAVTLNGAQQLLYGLSVV